MPTLSALLLGPTRLPPGPKTTFTNRLLYWMRRLARPYRLTNAKQNIDTRTKQCTIEFHLLLISIPKLTSDLLLLLGLVDLGGLALHLTGTSQRTVHLAWLLMKETYEPPPRTRTPTSRRDMLQRPWALSRPASKMRPSLITYCWDTGTPWNEDWTRYFQTLSGGDEVHNSLDGGILAHLNNVLLLARNQDLHATKQLEVRNLRENERKNIQHARF